MQGNVLARSKSFQPLTKREYKILDLLSQNLSDQEIATRLFVARTTVKWYNRQIYNKLGVKNRHEAIEVARSMGLLHVDRTLLSPRHDLPIYLTPFIGRNRDLVALCHWVIQPKERLLTILAPGGWGKTRLALEVARLLLDQFADGVWFVPLAGITSSELIASTIAEALKFQFQPDERSPKQQLLNFLQHKHLMLVLDNFEHLLSSTSLLAELLMAAPQVKVLVTSRERLNLTSEQIYFLGTMEVPDTVSEDEVLNYDGVQLFTLCAQRANPHVMLKDVASIVRVCRLVQGMPLALELAAAWSGTLSFAEIADEIARSADFLQTSMADVPERLRSVRAVFEATWHRLSREEQQGFRRLAIFRGGCTLDAAQNVIGVDVGTLAMLINKSLLWRSPKNERYEVHDLLRQYAEEQLNAAGEAESIARAHQHYYADIAKKWGAAMLSDRLLEGLAALDADVDNVRVALAHATVHATPETIEPFTDLWLYYDIRSRWAEADTWFRAAGDALGTHDSIAKEKLLTARSFLYDRLGKREAASETSKQSYEMILRLGVRHRLPYGMSGYADALFVLGKRPEALSLYQNALAVAEEINDPFLSAMLTYSLGIDAEQNGRTDEARDKLRGVYAIGSKLNNPWIVGWSLNALAIIAIHTSDLEDAEQLYSEYLENARAIGFQFAESMALQNLSMIAWSRRDWQTVYELSRSALATHYRTGRLDSQAFSHLVGVALGALMLTNLQVSFYHLREAFRLRKQLLLQTGLIGINIVAGGYLLRSGEVEKAVVLLFYGQDQIAQSNIPSLQRRIFSDLLYGLIDECRASLSPTTLDLMSTQAKLLTAEDIVAELSRIL